MLPDYSRAQIFRYVDIAKKDNVLVQYDIGIYFMPTITFFGEQSVMSVDKVIEKKYLMNNKQIYGVFSGIKLLNMFGVTTQMAGIVEIVTNKESSKKRTIEMQGRKIILRKSRCQITKENYVSYMLLELFSCIGTNENINKNATETIMKFIKDQNLDVIPFTKMAKYFPSKALKNFVRSGVIYGLIQ